eukprot:3069978-Amphidinium_carterae.1
MPKTKDRGWQRPRPPNPLAQAPMLRGSRFPRTIEAAIPMSPHKQYWISEKIRVFPRKSAGFRENPRVSEKIRGFPRKSA